MANKVSLHFRNERANRATYIAQTVGFGEVIRTAEYFNRNNLYEMKQVTETGVLIVRGGAGQIVTMYIMKPEQLTEIYKLNHWGRVPAWLMAKAKKNKQKGYTQNQPDFH